MSLTPEKREELYNQIVGIEAGKIISELTWNELLPQISALSEDEGNAITLAITGRGESATPLIERKLKEFVVVAAAQKVDAYFDSLTDEQIGYLARLLW